MSSTTNDSGRARYTFPKYFRARTAHEICLEHHGRLLVVLSLVSFAEHFYLLEHASQTAKAKCVNEPGWYYPKKYSNCLCRNL